MTSSAFSTREELTSFQRLLGVSGVGPKAALAILSSTTPEQFALAVMTGDEKALIARPGRGQENGAADHSGAAR